MPIFYIIFMKKRNLKLITLAILLTFSNIAFASSYKNISLTGKSIPIKSSIIKYMNANESKKAKKEPIKNSTIIKTINKYASWYNINPQIIFGMAIKESNLTAAPKDSSANCRGMCQISHAALDGFNSYWWTRNEGSYNEKKNAMYTWEDMYDYRKNIEVACWYLYWLQKYKGIKDLRDLLLAYNIGPEQLLINKKTGDINYKYSDDIIKTVFEIKKL